MEDKTTMLRQGDVLLQRVSDIPDDVTPVSREKGAVVLAHGEVTGHSHRIPSRYARLYRTETDARYLRATAPVALRHEEHTTVKIPAGDYRVIIHHEYAPEAIRRVED